MGGWADGWISLHLYYLPKDRETCVGLVVHHPDPPSRHDFLPSSGNTAGDHLQRSALSAPSAQLGIISGAESYVAQSHILSRAVSIQALIEAAVKPHHFDPTWGKSDGFSLLSSQRHGPRLLLGP